MNIQFEEMERDNDLNSILLFHHSRHAKKKHTFKRLAFIPEHHGISQSESKDTFKEYIASLSQYHPQCISGFNHHQGSRGRYPYYNFKTVPILPLLATRSYFSVHYVMIKPWLKLDVLASKKHQYWSVTLEKACQLNYLFKVSL